MIGQWEKSPDSARNDILTFDAICHLSTADGSSSWLPVHMNDLEITVRDLNTNKQIGEGHWKDKTISRKDVNSLALPVNFSYTAFNATDSTCKSFGVFGMIRDTFVKLKSD